MLDDLVVAQALPVILELPEKPDGIVIGERHVVSDGVKHASREVHRLIKFIKFIAVRPKATLFCEFVLPADRNLDAPLANLVDLQYEGVLESTGQPLAAGILAPPQFLRRFNEQCFVGHEFGQYVEVQAVIVESPALELLGHQFSMLFGHDCTSFTKVGRSFRLTLYSECAVCPVVYLF